jgi:hypothetical protein
MHAMPNQPIQPQPPVKAAVRSYRSGVTNKPVRSWSDFAPLQAGNIYHIYNRGVNGETIFRQKRNYEYFIKLYVRHIQPVADTYAFCIMPNHFHFLIEVKGNLAGPGDLSGVEAGL